MVENGRGTRRRRALPVLIGAAMLIGLPPAEADASETVRIAIAAGRKSVVVRSGAGLFQDGNAGSPGTALTIDPSRAGTRPLRLRSADGVIRVDDRPYRGEIEVRKDRNGTLLVVNELDLEDYLKGVVAGEMPRDWEAEALKAQAVVARSFALYQKQAAGRRPYHLGATVNGQVYAGVRGERPEAARAVEETEGIVIAYNGVIIPAFFHSSCGGHTEDASELWGIDEPYLKGVDCECQRISRYGVWEKRIGIDAIAKALRRLGYRVPPFTTLRAGSITAAGRVREIEIPDGREKFTVPAEDLRRAVGYSGLPSVFFELSVSGREAVFSGRGMGHGVGLCQWGAKWMAQQGFGYQSIINHYYPGTWLALLDDLR